MTLPSLNKTGLKNVWLQIQHALGVPAHKPSMREQLVAVLTSAAGIAMVAWVSIHSIGASSHTPVLIASIGATAVLVFAVPHGPLSQPWAVLGGQSVSALVGLAVAHTTGGGFAAETLSVALAIGAMHILRCIHPPGGATALSVVLATHNTEIPGWTFVLDPVLLNVSTILLAAFILNLPFAWRRYPASFHLRHHVTPAQLGQEFSLTQQHLQTALAEIDEVIDISDEQLQTLYQTLARQQENTSLQPQELKGGAYYSNGLSGESWAVRQIIDRSEADARKQQIIYKTVAGANRGEIRLIDQKQFANWARYEVLAGDTRWQRVH